MLTPGERSFHVASIALGALVPLSVPLSRFVGPGLASTARLCATAVLFGGAFALGVGRCLFAATAPLDQRDQTALEISIGSVAGLYVGGVIAIFIELRAAPTTLWMLLCCGWIFAWMAVFVSAWIGAWAGTRLVSARERNRPRAARDDHRKDDLSDGGGAPGP